MTPDDDPNVKDRRGIVLGYWITLLREARRSAKRAREAYEEDEAYREAGASASAILCAAAPCEAILSEELTDEDNPQWGPPEYVEKIRSTGSATGKWKQLLGTYASDFDPSASPEYDALCCLFEIRHLVAHRRARWMYAGEWPAPIADCVRQGIVTTLEIDGHNWTSVLFTATVAEWACKAAEEWINFVVPKLPQAQYSKTVHELNEAEE